MATKVYYFSGEKDLEIQWPSLGHWKLWIGKVKDSYQAVLYNDSHCYHTECHPGDIIVAKTAGSFSEVFAKPVKGERRRRLWRLGLNPNNEIRCSFEEEHEMGHPGYMPGTWVSYYDYWQGPKVEDPSGRVLFEAARRRNGGLYYKYYRLYLQSEEDWKYLEKAFKDKGWI